MSASDPPVTSEDPDVSWEAVIGQPGAVAALRAAVGADEVGHAWLVVGQRDVGQDPLITAFAAALNCPTPPAPGLACGTCGTCRRIGRGVHPAVQSFEPDGASHLVEDVRASWMPAAMTSLPDARRKVLRIASADRMNEAAQNAFLKVLEEPPASVVWVLEVEDESRLLETVVSRCRRLDLAPWGPADLEAHAARVGVAPDGLAAIARASMGSPQRVTDLADPDVAAARRRHLGLIDELTRLGPGAVVPIAKELAAWAKSRNEPQRLANERELERLEEAFGVEGARGWPPGVKQRITKRFERSERSEQQRALSILLDDVASYLRDLVALGAGGDAASLVNIDHVDALTRDVARMPPTDALLALEAVGRCRAALARNGAVELHLERLLMAVAVPLYARRMRAA